MLTNVTPLGLFVKVRCQLYDMHRRKFRLLSFAHTYPEIFIIQLESQVNAIFVEPWNAFAQQLQYKFIGLFLECYYGYRV